MAGVKLFFRNRQWLRTTLLSMGIFAACALQLFARRDWQINLYLINKVLASTGLILISLSVILGAIKRYWPTKVLLGYAKPLGILGFVYSTLHVALTVWISLSRHYPNPKKPGHTFFELPHFLVEQWLSMLLAAVSFGLLIYLIRKSIAGARGGPVGVTSIQLKSFKLSLGLIAVLTGFWHATLLKYNGWFKWLSLHDQPALPPLSLMVGLVVYILIVLGLRQISAEALKNKQGLPTTGP